MKNFFTTQFGKTLLIIIGTISLILGIIGIILPLLPTTPFLLLTAACYIKSSEKLYNWLLNHKIWGSYIKNYLEHKAIPLKTKIFAISLLWLTILFSIFSVVANFWVKIGLFLIAVAVTIHLLRLKTLRKNN